SARMNPSMLVRASSCAVPLPDAGNVSGAVSDAPATRSPSTVIRTSSPCTVSGCGLGLDRSRTMRNIAFVFSTRSSETTAPSTSGGLGRGTIAHAATRPKRASAKSRPRCLDIEPVMHDIAVVDNVLPAFEPHPSGFLRPVLPAVPDVIVERDHLGADEAALEVGVDDARGLRRRGADAYRPRADLLLACGEERLESEEREAGMDHAIEPGLGHPHVRQEECLVVRLQVRDLRFDRRGDRNHGGLLARDVRTQSVEQR